MLSTLCRLANRLPGVYVGRMPLVPIDEVRWFDRSSEYELRLWSVTVVIDKPRWLRRPPDAYARLLEKPGDEAHG